MASRETRSREGEGHVSLVVRLEQVLDDLLELAELEDRIAASA